MGKKTAYQAGNDWAKIRKVETAWVDKWAKHLGKAPGQNVRVDNLDKDA